MRKGEAAALKWPDIDPENQLITIDETLDFTAKDKEGLFGETKTIKSERTIKISQSLANDLKYHQEWQKQNKGVLGERYHLDLDLVLCREDGNYMPKSSLFNAFSRILDRSDLHSLPIHSLRHTCAVLLLEAGADMKFVQEQLGHGKRFKLRRMSMPTFLLKSRKAIWTSSKYLLKVFFKIKFLWAFCGHSRII